MNVGDRIKIISSHENTTNINLNGLTGTIIDLVSLSTLIGVEFDEYVDGHECDGSGKYGYCWYVYKYSIKLDNQGDISEFKKELDLITL